MERLGAPSFPVILEHAAATARAARQGQVEEDGGGVQT
jgi:hypothetical protein